MYWGKPQFQPISEMPLIATGIEQILQANEGQMKTLNELKGSCYLLDGATVSRIVNNFSEQKEYLVLYDKQLSLWQQATLSVVQQARLEDMQQSLSLAQMLNHKILKVVDALHN